MIVKKVIYVEIPGGYSDLISVDRSTFQTETENAIDGYFEKNRDVIESAITADLAVRINAQEQLADGSPEEKAFGKFFRIGIGNSAEEAEKSFTAWTGVEKPSRGEIKKAIAVFLRSLKKSDVVEVETVPAATAFPDFEDVKSPAHSTGTLEVPTGSIDDILDKEEKEIQNALDAEARNFFL
jgi:hypothetical protein